jgi:hypothetical protein
MTGIVKSQIFFLISNMQTYHCEIMHVKEVMYCKKCYKKTVFISAYELNMMYCDCNFVNQVSLHTLNQYKSCDFYIHHDLFQEKIFIPPIRPADSFNVHLSASI